MANGQNQPNQQGQGGQQQGRGQQQQQRNVSLTDLEIISGPDRATRIVSVRTVVQFGNQPFLGEVLFTLNDQDYRIVRVNTRTGEAVCQVTLPDENEHRIRAHVVGHPGKSTMHLPVRVPPASAPGTIVPDYATVYRTERREGTDKILTAISYASKDGRGAVGVPVEFSANGRPEIILTDQHGYARRTYRARRGRPTTKIDVNIPVKPLSGERRVEHADLYVEAAPRMHTLRIGVWTFLASIAFFMFNLFVVGIAPQPLMTDAEVKNVMEDPTYKIYFKGRESELRQILQPRPKEQGIAENRSVFWWTNLWVFLGGLALTAIGLLRNFGYFARAVRNEAFNRREETTAGTQPGVVGQAGQAAVQTGVGKILGDIYNWVRAIIVETVFH